MTESNEFLSGATGAIFREGKKGATEKIKNKNVKEKIQKNYFSRNKEVKKREEEINCI